LPSSGKSLQAAFDGAGLRTKANLPLVGLDLNQSH
jgi:hypothetical protein